MIHIVCPNPALDRSIFLTTLSPNIVNRPSFTKDLLGGKGFNVIRPFLYKGYSNYRVHTLLGGHIGDTLKSMITQTGVNCEITAIEDNNRVCSIIVDKHTNDIYQIYEAGPTIKEQEKSVFLQGILNSVEENDFVVFSGSLPMGIHKDFYKNLIHDLQLNNVKCILDTSGEYLEHGITSKPWLIKINEEEFLELLNLNEDKSVEEIIELIRNYKQTENLIVTMGKNGVVAKFGSTLFKVKQPLIEVVNPIASGDIFLGVLVQILSQNNNYYEAIWEACSYSLSNCLHWYPDLNEQEIEQFKNQITIENL